ncbi:Uncharacterised protein [Serratia ficaria]|uniref:hypothetical protein n=1 Tax=Serratia ficaria TaxID=61651 RepID=UPI002182F565|nr:hypothetical protein [Serratia ficaria]CAI2534452.1 Uncharacterised protein [Serratia ficaria]
MNLYKLSSYGMSRTVLVCLLFFSGAVNAATEQSLFYKSCIELDAKNKVTEGVRVEHLSVFSMRLSGNDIARSIKVCVIDMKGVTGTFNYSIVEPSPTDNILVNYILLSKQSKTLLDICSNEQSTLYAISDHYFKKE